MRNNETGEYELVVGNRQLLSGFFIVVLLCAVAFAMGYVVGENAHSVRAPETASVPRRPVDTRADAAPTVPPPEPRPAQPADSASVPPAETAPDPAAAASDPKGTAAENPPPQPVTQPARDVTEPRAEPRRRKPEPPPPEPKVAVETAPGQYWQVTATTNHKAAEDVLQALRDKGFHATLSPGPNNFTRVLVGPYTDTASLGRAKTELEGAGFSHLVRK